MATKPICKIDGCDKVVAARGWCGKHYSRWRTHGDPLALGYLTPARDFYERTVLSYEGDECLFWPYARTAAGYGQIGMHHHVEYVHRLVCEHINGAAPTPRHHAAHSCGNGHLGCVNPRHLSWKTPSENADDKLAHGTAQRGERHGQAKLNEDQVRNIRELKGTASQAKLAEKFGVSPTTIGQIHSRKVWGWLR